MDNKKKGGSGIIIVIVIVAILWAIGSCSGESSSTSSRSDKCQVCGRTFTNSEDVSSIAYTNMCKTCYNNYKYKENLKEELKKQQERK